MQLPFFKREMTEALAQPEEVKRVLKLLERRDWRLWAFSITVTLVLVVGTAILSLSALEFDFPHFLKFEPTHSIRGLLALVVLLSLYTMYQLYMLFHLRQALGEQRLKTEEFRQLALFDSLTGVYNRRAAEARIAEEIKRCTRDKAPLTLAVLDLDDFKEINDNFGHLGGDLALKEFALRLKRASRGSDIVARIGGDEFLLLLPECSDMQLRIVLRRLEPLEVECEGQRVKFSFSAGWATYAPGETPDQFLNKADRALYARKRVQTPGVSVAPGAAPAGGQSVA